jgi:hypothetical protein
MMRILLAEYDAIRPLQKRSESLGCLERLFVPSIADPANRTSYWPAEPAPEARWIPYRSMQRPYNYFFGGHHHQKKRVREDSREGCRGVCTGSEAEIRFGMWSVGGVSLGTHFYFEQLSNIKLSHFTALKLRIRTKSFRKYNHGEAQERHVCQWAGEEEKSHLRR